MKVNFIDEFRLIMRYSKDEGLSLRERSLWVALFYIANDRAKWDMYTESYEWPSEFFGVNTAELSLYSSLDKRGIETARKSLKERGIIDFVAGEKNARIPQYKINYLSICTGHKVVPNDYIGTRYNDVREEIEDVDGDADAAEGADMFEDHCADCVNLNTNCTNDAPNSVPNSVPNDAPNSVSNSAPIYININKEKDKGETDIIYPSIEERERNIGNDGRIDTMDSASREKTRIVIENNLDYDTLLENNADSAKELWEIKELIVDTVCSRRSTIRVGGEERPLEVVKDQFLRLRAEHIEYAMNSMKNIRGTIRDMKGYLLTVLYNAPFTIENHVSAAAWRDLNGGMRDEQG